jgi:ATP synthase protein I
MNDDKLRQLDEKLTSIQQDKAKKLKPEAEGINSGARAGMELVTSIIAGTLIGYGLDRWLGTKPWMLILFLFLGVGTGFWSVYRISNNLGSAVGFAALQKAQKTATKPPQNSDDEDD